MYKEISSDKEPIDKLLTLICNAPNVNNTIFRKLRYLQHLIKEHCNHLCGFVDLGSCFAYSTVDNAGAGKRLPTKYAKEVDQLYTGLRDL